METWSHQRTPLFFLHHSRTLCIFSIPPFPLDCYRFRSYHFLVVKHKKLIKIINNKNNIRSNKIGVECVTSHHLFDSIVCYIIVVVVTDVNIIKVEVNKNKIETFDYDD